MTRPRLLLFLGIALILLGLGAGVRWYLFGANEVDAAELVPANTVFFATIPNGATLLEGYQTSKVKTLLDSPNAKPLRDAIVNVIGQKNVDLIQTFLPNLSGQSFIAVTHFDYDHPEQIGLIAAMKPKAGLGDFGAFLDKIKTTWPDLLKQGKIGTGTVAGVDYQWLQGPGAPDKICVAQVNGWIVTSWGEASLQDWVERFRKKSSTSSLARDLGYRKSLARVGDDPMTLVYINYHSVMEILQKQMAKTNPVLGDYLARKLDALGGAALAARFENGEIVDRFSFLIPRPAQLEAGMGADPCPFETLKFTGPDTRFYWASSINWKQYYKHLKEQPGPSSYQHETFNPMTNVLLNFLQTWVRGTSLDVQQNIVDALGPEISVQAEWSPDATYPEVGLFVKLDKPDDFKPTIAAIIESVRKTYATSAVIKEINSNGRNFAALQFVQSAPISPTITEDGPYLGIFLTENQAVRSFQRDETSGLTHRADFNRQMGDKRTAASQIIFLDSPQLLDRAYRTTMPFLSLAGMFNKDLAAMLKGRDLPTDLTWLAPMGTWSCVITPDEEGVQGYSVSGIGNQGIFLAGAFGGTAGVMQTMGLLPKPAGALATTSVPATPPAPSPPTPPSTQQNAAGNIKAAPLPTLPAVPLGDGAPDLNATTGNATNEPPGAIIYITSASRIFFDNTPLLPDQLGDFLKSKKAANQALKLAVRVDKDSSPDVLSRVMDAGASAGFGVLPYTYTSGADSLPPMTNSGSAATPPLPNAATNAVPAPVPENAPATHSAPASSNLLATPPIQDAAPQQAPASNADPYAATQPAPLTNSNPDAAPPTPEPVKTQ